MTQVKEMSNQQLNRALAELMGKKPLGGKLGYVLLSDSSLWYCTDAAASLEVQTAACERDGDRYIWELAIIQGWVGGKLISRKECVRIATATPRERAEAAYLTLSEVSGQ